MIRLMEDPDFDICPCVILVLLQPVTVGSGVGLDVGVGVFVGVLVMVGVKDGAGVSVAVGLSVMVGVRDGVSVNIGVIVGVDVGVSVGISVLVAVGADVLVGMAVDRSGVLVTTIAMPMTIVRALIPRIGSPLATERSIKGTNFGTIGKKSPSMVTWMRLELSDDGVTSSSTVSSPSPDPSHVSKGVIASGPLS
jgi:hypothetical protein